jgi:hypothetical protein
MAKAIPSRSEDYCYLGKNAAGSGSDVQGYRTFKRLFPFIHP